MLFAGGMAGIFNWMVALPPDVVKSRLQSGIYVLRENNINCDSCLFIFNLLIVVVVLQLTWLYFSDSSHLNYFFVDYLDTIFLLLTRKLSLIPVKTLKNVKM